MERQRGKNVELVTAKDARKLVAPFASHIAQWQHSVALVVARMGASRTDELERHNLLATADAIKDDVSHCLRKLNNVVLKTRPEVAANSRIADVQHALVGILERIDHLHI